MPIQYFGLDTELDKVLQAIIEDGAAVLIDAAEKKAIEKLLQEIKKLEGEISSEDYQNIVYKVGKEVFPNDLRQWFISLYQILFGSDSGPRLGSFFNVYGKSNVLFLLEETIK